MPRYGCGGKYSCLLAETGSSEQNYSGMEGKPPVVARCTPCVERAATGCWDLSERIPGLSHETTHQRTGIRTGKNANEVPNVGNGSACEGQGWHGMMRIPSVGTEDHSKRPQGRFSPGGIPVPRREAMEKLQRGCNAALQHGSVQAGPGPACLGSADASGLPVVNTDQ